MTGQNKPYVIKEEPGEKYWCACGQSGNPPYCDGAHDRLKTGKIPIRVVIEAPREVVWCGCQKSEKKPFCDGTHKNLK